MINQGSHKIRKEASMKEVWVLVLRFFMLVSAVSPGSCLALDPRGRLGILGENVGSACEEFEDNEDGSHIMLMFLRVVVPAHPGCPGERDIKQLSLCVLTNPVRLLHWWAGHI